MKYFIFFNCYFDPLKTKNTTFLVVFENCNWLPFYRSYSFASQVFTYFANVLIFKIIISLLSNHVNAYTKSSIFTRCQPNIFYFVFLIILYTQISGKNSLNRKNSASKNKSSPSKSILIWVLLSNLTMSTIFTNITRSLVFCRFNTKFYYR